MKDKKKKKLCQAENPRKVRISAVFIKHIEIMKGLCAKKNDKIFSLTTYLS